MLYLIADKPRENRRLNHLDALPRLRPVEAFEQPMVEEPQPVPVCTWWELLGLLIVTAFGAAGVYAAICMVML